MCKCMCVRECIFSFPKLSDDNQTKISDKILLSSVINLLIVFFFVVVVVVGQGKFLEVACLAQDQLNIKYIHLLASLTDICLDSKTVSLKTFLTHHLHPKIGKTRRNMFVLLDEKQ